MKKLEQRANLITNKILKEDNLRDQNLLLTEMKKIGIEKLPYSYSALKKFIDSKTMNVHYNKHYKGYVDKLNKALKKKDYGDLELEQIVKSIGRFNNSVRNNAGGAFNHAMFWKMLSPKKQTLSGNLLEKIKKDFGTYEKFKKEFEQVAKDRFGSGWVWLILTKRNKLKVVSTPNQDNPLMSSDKDGGYPLLGLDLWEHAYYLKYQNKRDEYIQNFWDVVNWEFVNNLYKMKTETKLKESVILKNVLNEQSLQRCNSETKEAIRVIFNMNPRVKSIFRAAIDSILKSVFSENWYERDEYEPNTLSGIYDFESEGRSVVNKLNTNYNAFCILLHDMNRVLERENKEKLDIIGVPYTKQINETIRFSNYLEEYKDRIFNVNSPTFKNLMNILQVFNELGDKTERQAVESLKKRFGNDNVKLTGGLGKKEDALGGEDCIVFINGKKNTGQIKPYKFFNKIDNHIKLSGTAQSQQYDTDLIIFHKTDDSTYPTLVFKNEGVEIVDGDYLIPIKSLVR